MTIEEIVAELKALVEKAQTEDRPLTDEEVERYESLEGDLKQRQKTAEIQKRQTAYESVRPAVNVGTSSKTDDTLERAFDGYLRTGRESADLVELRAQSVGTNSAGGYTVPDSMRQKIVDRLKAFGGVANEVEVITTASGEDLRWPTLDDTGNAGVIASEGGAPGSGGADLVFGEGLLQAYKYVAPGASNLPLRVSVELLQDSAYDIEGLVRDKLSTRIARAQSAHWVNGTGTGQPDGIATKATGPTYAATGAALTYADLVAAKHTVDPEYRTNAVWSFNDATFAQLEGLVDGNGRPLLFQSTDSITGAPQFMLLGHRVVIDQAFANYTDATTNVWGVFGDLKEGYVIRRVKDVQVIVNPYSRANEGQVEYTMWARADGTVQNPFAYATLTNAA